MKDTWLVIDCSYICYRCFYSMPHLSHEEIPTTVMYGFFREIDRLKERFATDKVAFCFDSKNSKRKEELPSYKENRGKDQSEEKQILMENLKKQITHLSTVLKEMGFQNVYLEDGFEADDLIASLVDESSNEEIIIVTADHDLFQCLVDGDVLLYNPAKDKIMNRDSFYKEHGLYPDEYWKVNAIAGCPTDNIKGVKGVGEKTAIKYLTGKLKKDSAVSIDITRFAGSKEYLLNKTLVRLPFPGTPELEFKEEKVDLSKVDEVLSRYGIKTVKRTKRKGLGI